MQLPRGGQSEDQPSSGGSVPPGVALLLWFPLRFSLGGMLTSAQPTLEAGRWHSTVGKVQSCHVLVVCVIKFLRPQRAS